MRYTDRLLLTMVKQNCTVSPVSGAVEPGKRDRLLDSIAIKSNRPAVQSLKRKLAKFIRFIFGERYAKVNGKHAGKADTYPPSGWLLGESRTDLHWPAVIDR